jgi:hypothetical protein
MTRRPQAARLAMTALVLIAGIGPAVAFEDAFGDPVSPRARVIRRSVRPVPPSAVFSGYLPRNYAVPLYNEPPRRPSFGYGGR